MMGRNIQNSILTTAFMSRATYKIHIVGLGGQKCCGQETKKWSEEKK